MTLLRDIVAKLPECWKFELKRIRYKRQIKKGTFLTPEPEYELLHHFIRPGDWVIDVGANIGHYTKKFSELVGADGRVIAFEPVPTTFSLLAVNTQEFIHANVTLVNAAVSNKFDIAHMSIPSLSSGLANYYQAAITRAPGSTLSVLTVSLDSILPDHPIALIKIDVEGHEAAALEGMQAVILKYHPIIILETGSSEIVDQLAAQGYDAEVLPNSPNTLLRSAESQSVSTL